MLTAPATQVATGTGQPVRRAGLVVRVSTERQAATQEGSLKNQLQRLRQHIAYKRDTAGERWDVAAVYELPAISGKISVRSPEFERLFADVTAGRIDAVLCTELDRIGRTVTDLVHFAEVLDASGVDFVCLKQNFDTTTPNGRFFFVVMAALAQLERELTADRTREAARARAARGLWTGGQLLGYDLDPDHKGHLIPNQAEAVIVNAAFDTYLECGSIAQTTGILNRHGYRTKAYTSQGGRHHPGTKFSTTSVQHLLKNLAHIGKKPLNVRNRGRADAPDADQYQVLDAVWPAIVDAATFERVHALMAQNGRANSNGAKPVGHVHILRGVIHCGRCHSPMVGRSGTGQQGTTYFYYVCADKECGFRVSAQEIEGAVLDRCSQLAQDNTLVGNLVQATNHWLARRRPGLLKRRRAITRDISGVKTRAERVIDEWAESPNGGSRNFVEERLGGLARRREDLERGLADVEAEVAAVERGSVTATSVTAALGRFRDLYAFLRPNEQRDLMRLLVSRIEVRDREIVLELYPDACSALISAESPQSEHLRFEAPVRLLGQDSNLQPCG